MIIERVEQYIGPDITPGDEVDDKTIPTGLYDSKGNFFPIRTTNGSAVALHFLKTMAAKMPGSVGFIPRKMEREHEAHARTASYQ